MRGDGDFGIGIGVRDTASERSASDVCFCDFSLSTRLQAIWKLVRMRWEWAFLGAEIMMITASDGCMKVKKVRRHNIGNISVIHRGRSIWGALEESLDYCSSHNIFCTATDVLPTIT